MHEIQGQTITPPPETQSEMLHDPLQHASLWQFKANTRRDINQETVTYQPGFFVTKPVRI